MAYWVSSKSQKDGESADEFLNGSPNYLNFDSYAAGWCDSPQMTDQMFAAFPSSSPVPSMAMTYPLPFDPSNFVEQTSPTFSSSMDYNVITGSYDNLFQPMGSLFHQDGDDDDDDSLCWKGVCKNVSDDRNYSIIPRSPPKSLSEKMLKALSLFKDFSGDGILAQLWVPIKQGDRHILSTCEQPFLLDQTLAGYREVSRMFTFSAEVRPGSSPGLPGRVFSSKVPEWTSNIVYYSKEEYLRVEHAVSHHIRGSIAIPVFENDPNENSCCAVLELVTTDEKPDFELEMENVCRALEAVNLKSSSRPRFHPQCLSKNQRAALAEITDVLRTICHAHKLPLALTWIPCSYSQGIGYESTQVQVQGCNPSGPNRKCILCIEDSACYVNDPHMQGFVLACQENYLEEGQGVAGKALQSIHPFFSANVKSYDIYEYPLVHHARKFHLNSVVAIRLRSTFTGDEDYIIEFFLPVDMKGSTEQQLLLNSLAGTMQRICKSLRTVSDADKKVLVTSLPNVGCSLSSVTDMIGTEPRPDSIVQVNEGLTRQVEKKRSTAEKSVSLSVLQKYFSGSLKDAAKSLGVCPTTLKRICRQQGISRWPSRKINKVNRSLKKIQTVLNSVQGVEGSLKFDPSTGSLIAAGTIPTREPDAVKDVSKTSDYGFPFQSCGEGENYPVNVEPCVDSQKLSFSVNEIDVDTMNFDASGIVDDPKEITQPTSSGMTDSSNGSGSSAQVSSSSTQSFGERKNNSKMQTSFSGDGGSKITVKATYKEDTVRFKFDPSAAAAGCDKLYEEVAMRFKLQLGTFQLKYLDDEDEWVMLVNDSDLQECLEILDLVGTRTVKFLVRETSCVTGSSGSSSSFLVGCSR